MAYFFFGLALILTYLKPIETFFPELVELRLTLVVTLLTFLMTGLVRIADKKKYFESKHLALLFMLIFSICMSQASKGWIGGAIESVYSFSFSAVVFVLAVWNTKTLGQLKKTAGLLVLCAFSLACLSIAAFHLDYMADQLVIVDITPSNTSETGFVQFARIRSLGFLNDPNDFAQFLLVNLAFGVALIKNEKRVLHGCLAVIGASVLLYAIYLTHSRGAVVTFAVMLFLYLGRLIGSVAAGAISITGVVLLATLGLLGGGRSISAEDNSAGGRVEAWSQGLLMLKSNPLFGVGYNGFLDFHSHTAHNSLVLCFAELGLVGYFAWSALILFVFLCLKDLLPKVDSKEKNIEEFKWVRGVYIGLIVFLVSAQFLSRTYSPTLYLLLGMGVSAARIARIEFSKLETGQSSLHISKSLIRSGNWLPVTLVFMTASIFLVHVGTRLYWLAGF